MKTLLILIISFVTLSSCYDNSTNSQDDSGPYTGISKTLSNGKPISFDSSDWKMDFKVIGKDTFKFIPYPVYPNPLYGNIFNIQYETNNEAFFVQYITKKYLKNNAIKIDTVWKGWSDWYMKGIIDLDYDAKPILNLGEGIYRLHISVKMYTNESHTDSVILKSFGDIQVAK